MCISSKSLFAIYSQPGARLNRKGFLLGWSLLWVFIPLLSVTPVVLIYYLLGYSLETFGNAQLWFKLLMLGYYLLFFYTAFFCFLSIHIKRLHDLNHLGWWLLALPLYPIIFFFLAIKKGNPKENQFGEPVDFP